MTMLMNINTGSVAPLEEWEADFASMGAIEFGFESVDEAMCCGCLVEVTKNKDGDWVEVN